MDLLPTAEQQSIADTAAEFLRNEMSTALIRGGRGDAACVPAVAWKEGAALGLLGLSLPEEHGGADAGLAEEMLVFREVGRIPAPGPFLSCVLGARVAAVAGDADLAASIVGGDAQVGLGLPRPGTVSGPIRLDGPLDLLDVPVPGHVLLIAEDGAGLVHTDALSDVNPGEAIDPGVRISDAVAGNAPLLHYIPADREPLYLRATVLTAALLTGIAEAVRDASVAHAKTREQFGRPIGVHQAIKHRCADMAVRAEAAMAQTFFAAIAVDEGRPDAELQARSALIVAARAARLGAAENVQIHGGIGYTFEADAHLYVKRAEVWSQVLGGRAGHLDRLLRLPEAA
ncbi:acyl-CoA dehydrogenase family protein [Actinomadura sp. SCN-SB]|uniref:acyl-CoA dehydrogenase family protein n=1 Tax=Actinomadura sp. SCN-SB TaxID=3373092 RepID=UPI003752725F